MSRADHAFDEQALLWRCEDRELLGIACLPEAAARSAVLIVVGGPQYRAGSHRQFVLLARHLARQGIASLRFDLRGMGDSEGEHPGFEDAAPDIGSAIDALLAAAGPGVDQVAIWGLCDAASAALLYWDERRDPRVSGLCLLNPWVRSIEGLARTHVKHYYVQRLREREFWIKLLSGRVAARAAAGLLSNLKLALRPPERKAASRPSFQQSMARAWMAFPGAMALILSGRDLTAKEFLEHCATDPAWQGALQRPRLQRHDLAEADHTFSAPADSAAAERLTQQWLASLLQSAPAEARLKECA